MTSHGERDSADVTTLRILRWGDCAGFSGCILKAITRVLMRGRPEDPSRVRKGAVRMEAEAGVVRGHQPRNAGGY